MDHIFAYFKIMLICGKAFRFYYKISHSTETLSYFGTWIFQRRQVNVQSTDFYWMKNEISLIFLSFMKIQLTRMTMTGSLLNNKWNEVFHVKQTKCKHKNHQNCAYNVWNLKKKTHGWMVRRTDGRTNEWDMYAFNRKLLWGY